MVGCLAVWVRTLERSPGRGGGGGKAMGARTLPGAASGRGWPCRCWGASRPHRQTPRYGPTRYSPPSCLGGSARSGSGSDSGGGSAGDSASGAPPLPLPPWRARSPPAHDVISLVTAVAAVATRLALKGQAHVFRPPGVPAKTPPHWARGLRWAPSGGIRAGVPTSSPLIFRCPRVGVCGGREGRGRWRD